MQVEVQETLKRVIGKINDLGEGFKMKKLWENPNPTTAFAAQDLTLDMSEYDYILILVHWYGSLQYLIPPVLLPVTNGIQGSSVYARQDTSTRYFKIVDNKTLNIEAGIKAGFSNTTLVTDNLVHIPYQIYGIKLNSNQKYLAPDYMEDYIVEYGTEGIWTYRKWNSGIAECWGRVGSKSYTMTSSSGYGYYSSGSVTLPSDLFLEISSAVSDRCGGTTGNGLIATDISTITTTSLSYFIWDTASATLNVDVALNVKGRWK